MSKKHQCVRIHGKHSHSSLTEDFVDKIQLLNHKLVENGGSMDLALLSIVTDECERQRKLVCADGGDEDEIDVAHDATSGISTTMFVEDAKLNEEDCSEDILAKHSKKKITEADETRALVTLRNNHADVVLFEERLMSSSECVCLTNGRIQKSVALAESIAKQLNPVVIDEKSPVFPLIADTDLMKKFDLLLNDDNDKEDEEDKEKDDDDDDDEGEEKEKPKSIRKQINSFNENIRREIIHGKLAPQAFWVAVMQRINALLHTRAYLSISSAAAALIRNKEGIRYYVGGRHYLKSFTRETDLEKQMDFESCVDAKIPLASHGDIASDLVVFIPFEDTDGEEKNDDKDEECGSVSLYFGHTVFETSKLKKVNGGFQCTLLKCGIPCGTIRHMRARLSCRFPVQTLFGKCTSQIVQYRVTCILLPKAEKEFLSKHAIVIENNDENLWLFGNGMIAKLEDRACNKACDPEPEKPHSLTDIYIKSMIDNLVSFVGQIKKE